MRLFLIRLAEFFIPSIALSFTVTLLDFFNIIPPNHTSYGICFFISAIIYIILQIRMLRENYAFLQSKEIYYKYNYCAYSIYIVLGVILFFMNKSRTYTWIFGLTKSIHHFLPEISSLISAIIFHCIIILVIYFAPIGMQWVMNFKEEEEIEFFENTFIDDYEEEKQFFLIKEENTALHIKLAELNIEINSKYMHIENMCREYKVPGSDFVPDFSVKVTDEEIRNENENISGFSNGYLESLAVYRKIAENLLDYDGFLMHGVVLEYDGCGVAFIAKSGTGKSTHAKLWCDMLGSKCRIINGDKPLIRIKNGIPYAYGTPWSGKEGWHSNTCVPLKKLCFIERSLSNKCIPLNQSDVISYIINHIHVPDRKRMLEIVDLLDDLIQHTESYVIRCKPEPEAAITAFREITKERK